MEWFKSLKSHTVFNITDKRIGFFLSSTTRFSVMGGSVIYTSHFTVLYGAFQWPLSIVLWQKPQFVTFPVLHYWGQQLSNEYPFYLFLFQSYFSLVQAFKVIFLWLTAAVLLESDWTELQSSSYDVQTYGQLWMQDNGFSCVISNTCWAACEECKVKGRAYNPCFVITGLRVCSHARSSVRHSFELHANASTLMFRRYNVVLQVFSHKPSQVLSIIHIKILTWWWN